MNWNRLLQLWVVAASACLIYVIVFGKLDEWAGQLNPVPKPTAALSAYSEELQERSAVRNKGMDAYQAAAIIREVFVDARANRREQMLHDNRMKEIEAGDHLFYATPSE